MERVDEELGGWMEKGRGRGRKGCMEKGRGMNGWRNRK